MTKKQIMQRVNQILGQHTAGFFSDTSWQPIHATFKALSDAGFELDMTTCEYRHDSEGKPIAKVWQFEIPFVDDKGTACIIFVNITASGAGSVQDPLSRYDVVAYAN